MKQLNLVILGPQGGGKEIQAVLTRAGRFAKLFMVNPTAFPRESGRPQFYF